MLKITTEPNHVRILLRLEGKLLEAWIGEFLESWRLARSQSASIHLDLTNVSFVDVAGTVTLRALLATGVRITSCSPFVAELLKDTCS